ncbi:unnamed protein product, partial [Ectocarpus fasciculatus]
GGGNAVKSSAPPSAAAGAAAGAGPPKRQAGAPATTAKASSKLDGNRYMVCARQVTVREFPEFYAQDVGVVPEGGIVRVFEEKEEINEAKQTKDVWVRGQSPNTAVAAGSSRTGLVEGWLLAFSTKRGSMVADAPNALAAQHAFEKQENAATAAAKPTVVDTGPPPEEKAAATAVTAAAAASAVPTTASVGGYMRAAGQLKLREEADSLSLELGTVSRGELVKVEQTSGLWVRVLYRGDSAGWVLTANKRGASLTPAEAGPAAAAKEFQAQEAAAAATGGGGTANGAGDEDRPLTGAKAGSTAVSDGSGS